MRESVGLSEFEKISIREAVKGFDEYFPTVTFLEYGKRLSVGKDTNRVFWYSSSGGCESVEALQAADVCAA